MKLDNSAKERQWALRRFSLATQGAAAIAEKCAAVHKSHQYPPTFLLIC